MIKDTQRWSVLAVEMKEKQERKKKTKETQIRRKSLRSHSFLVFFRSEFSELIIFRRRKIVMNFVLLDFYILSFNAETMGTLSF